REPKKAFEVCVILPSRFLPNQEGRSALIELKPESPEELRRRLREMSDLVLRRFGQRARKLSDWGDCLLSCRDCAKQRSSLRRWKARIGTTFAALGQRWRLLR